MWMLERLETKRAGRVAKQYAYGRVAKRVATAADRMRRIDIVADDANFSKRILNKCQQSQTYGVHYYIPVLQVPGSTCSRYNCTCTCTADHFH